jgi:hypothetical protein
MAEWFKAAVLKTVDRKVRGFESLSLRHYLTEIIVSLPNFLSQAPLQSFCKFSDYESSQATTRGYLREFSRITSYAPPSTFSTISVLAAQLGHADRLVAK